MTNQKLRRHTDGDQAPKIAKIEKSLLLLSIDSGNGL
jgi:hypothetical protein